MFRSFCVGAVAGFLFGSTKKGQNVREGIDGFLTELTSGDAIKALDDKRNELSELATKTLSKFTGCEDNNKSVKEKSEEQNFQPERNKSDKSNEPEAKKGESSAKEDKSGANSKEDELEFSVDNKPLDADKAQELADKLGAKPSAPEDENLAAFHHDEELKSA